MNCYNIIVYIFSCVSIVCTCMCVCVILDGNIIYSVHVYYNMILVSGH